MTLHPAARKSKKVRIRLQPWRGSVHTVKILLRLCRRFSVATKHNKCPCYTWAHLSNHSVHQAHSQPCQRGDGEGRQEVPKTEAQDKVSGFTETAHHPHVYFLSSHLVPEVEVKLQPQLLACNDGQNRVRELLSLENKPTLILKSFYLLSTQ